MRYMCTRSVWRMLTVGWCADLDQRVFMHGHYSKGLIKKAGISPDAWIQTALQLAYFRDQGKFAQTYEASMTRLYRYGHTPRPLQSVHCCAVCVGRVVLRLCVL